MIFLSLACNNLYMFKNFFVDFTYSRASNHFLAKNDRLFKESNIKVRKNIIFLGGNASGKTTFGKLLCAINNYIVGREVDDSGINLYNAIYTANEDSFFEVEFAISNVVYRVKCVFNKSGIKEEYLKKVTISKNDNISKVREKLDALQPEIGYSNSNVDKNLNSIMYETIFYSKMLKNTAPKNEAILNELKAGSGFHYLFSHFAEQSASFKIMADVEMINNILPNIDNSVKEVVALVRDDDNTKTNTYMIIFKNGETIVIPKGDLLQTERERLSHGTYETIQFLNIIKEMKLMENIVIFIDENLAHLHVELEAYLLMKVFLLNKNSQLFVTTHNSEILDLNVPISTFALFKRCNEGYNKMLFISNVMNKNDRRIRNSYDNDRFGVTPDYSCLDKYFEEILYG